LEKPFKDYHDYQQKLVEWDQKRREIIGAVDIPDTLIFFQKEEEYILGQLETDIQNKEAQRLSYAISIYNQKQEIQKIYDTIKKSISDLLVKYSHDQNITLETSFKIEPQFFKDVFNLYVNRYKDFYHDGDNRLRQITLKYNLDDQSQLISFIDNIRSKDIAFKESSSEELFLNYIYSIDYLNPRYNLQLNQKSINELSPGERGGLLLIFYLILDKDDKPLVIDQPEDNLDNQSVSEILVPYIREAKKRRQIVMVTHNPNLAIVSDADQIIRMNIDKENDYLVSHISGAIENQSINKAVVDILEGKMKAFNNRKVKYYEKND